jgi:hypothetical protein
MKQPSQPPRAARPSEPRRTPLHRAATTAWILGGGLGLLSACSTEAPLPQTEIPVDGSGQAALRRPHLAALSTYQASVGTLIEGYGSDFPPEAVGQTFLVLTGTFDRADGTVEAVDIETPVRRVDGGTVRWTGFGPFRNPMSASGDQVGRFYGTMAARVVGDDGKIYDDAEPTEISFEVKPSILVHELQPLTASCNGPVKRALGGAAYRIRAEAIGFEPVSFTYALAAPALSTPPVVVRHLAAGRFDTVGERGDFRMPEVPDGVQSYSVVVTVSAVDAGGRTFQNAFALGVHRPLEVFYNGNVEVAEILAPVPVSGCIPGAQTGREVSYNETQSETRTRSYGVSWNEEWVSSHTVSVGSEETVGLSETNGVGFSTTDGQSWSWSLGGESRGGLDLGGLVEVGVTVSGSMGGERNTSQSRNADRSRGINESTTTTETESASESRGGSQGGSFAWEISSSDSISQTFGGTVIAGTFGVFYRQTIRLRRKAAVVTHNQCGAANVVADLDFDDWTWAPDLALGASCPPLPTSNLPPAECTLPPCSGR